MSCGGERGRERERERERENLFVIYANHLHLSIIRLLVTFECFVTNSHFSCKVFRSVASNVLVLTTTVQSGTPGLLISTIEY